MKINANERNFFRFVAILLSCFNIGFYAQSKSGADNFGLDVVVIDPGHGGKDPGCHGASAHEKDVCLSIGLALGEMIKEKYPEIKVIYTRETDVYIKLDERARIANMNDADLFICIHANAGQPKAYGVETYVMGLHKSEANLNVAKRENAVITMEDNYETTYSDFDGSPDAMLALQLQQSAYLSQSISYAGKIQAEMRSIGRKDRGVKQAGFVVLYRTRMPSVLIETGFLTNKEEEEFLEKKENQTLMAKSFFVAFEKYKKEIDAVNKKLNENIEDILEEQKEEVKNAKNIETSKSDLSSKIVFKVQIVTSAIPIQTTPENFKQLKNVKEYTSGGMYKYTYGEEDSFEKAKKILFSIKDKYKGSFIVAFKDGKRMDLQKARQLTKNK